MAYYEFTDKAKNDLSNIIEYTSKTWGSAQVNDYIDEIEVICQLLAQNPLIGKQWDKALISYPVGSHMMYYQHQDSTVTIIRILHKNMLPENYL